MKNTPLFMIVAAAVSVFTSCDGGETPDNNNGDNGDNGNPDRAVMVESITLHDEGSTFKTTFEYDNDGRVKKITEVDKGKIKSERQLAYSNNSVVMTSNIDSDVTTYTLNGDGYAVSMSRTGSSDRAGSSAAYEYDKEGYLIKETFSYPDTSNDVTSYTWADGCLKSLNDSWLSEDFTYGTDKNDNVNLDILALDIFDNMMALMGYLGKRNGYLVESVTGKSDDSKEDGTKTYRYEKDAEGRISEIYIKESNSGKEVLRYTVAYLK